MTTTITLPSEMPASVSLTVDFQQKDTEFTIEAIDWYLRRFTDLAMMGGFATGLGEQTFTIKHRNVSARRYITDIDADGVDIRCLLVLYFGIKAQLIGQGVTSATISVSANEPNRSYDIGELLDSAAEPYPIVIPELQRFIRSEVALASRRTIAFRVTGDLTSALLAKFEEVFAAWNDVSILAFPRTEERFENGREFMLNTAFEQSENRTICIQVDDFECHDSAINPIILALGSMLYSEQMLATIAIS